MKRTEKKISIAMMIFFITSLFSVVTVQAQDLETNNNSAIMDFETELIDYGTIAQNSNGMREFTFTNTGNAPLLITDVKSSCGCTVPTYSKEAILPGDEGQIKVKYNTKRLGAFSKTITVFSNSKQARKTLKIKGLVETEG